MSEPQQVLGTMEKSQIPIHLGHQGPHPIAPCTAGQARLLLCAAGPQPQMGCNAANIAMAPEAFKGTQ